MGFMHGIMTHFDPQRNPLDPHLEILGIECGQETHKKRMNRVIHVAISTEHSLVWNDLLSVFHAIEKFSNVGLNWEESWALRVEFGRAMANWLSSMPTWPGACMDEASQQLIEQVIARITRGRYLMTAHHADSRAGVLVDSAMWLMTEPLLIGVSMRKGHEIDPLIRDSRSFALGFVDEGDRFIARRFGKRLNGTDSAIYVEGLDPFDTLPCTTIQTGSPVLTQCSTWLDCEVLRRVDLENAYEFFVGSVVGIMHNGQSIIIERTEFVEDDD